MFFIKSLLKAGLQVSIVTSSEERDDSKEIYKKLNVKSIHVGNSNLYDLLDRLNGKIIFRWFSYLLSNLVNYLVVPDMQLGWWRKVLEKIDATGYDIVISASGSYSAHQAANKLSKKYNIPHIAELGDPWADNPIWPENMWHKKILNQYLERRSLSSAIAITTTNEKTKELYREKYPNCQVFSIPMGYDKSEVEIIPSDEPLGDKKIVFGHVGVSFKKSRDLTHLIESIGCSEKFQLSVVGPHSLSYEKLVASNQIDNVNFQGSVGYDKAVMISKELDVSVVVGNTGGLQIPGKLYFCLGLSKPLLYIYQDTNDPALAYLNKLPGVVTVFQGRREIEEVINGWSDQHDKLIELSRQRVTLNAIKDLEWSCIGNKFAKVVTDNI
tara:strand:+ start:13132 stop:14280 length:1149 start_codon:yes stop_codon:yes gene_type:complete